MYNGCTETNDRRKVNSVNGPRFFKKNERNYPVRKSIRIIKAKRVEEASKDQ